MAKYQYFRGKCCRIQQPYTNIWETRLGVPSIAGRLLKVIETCVYDLSLQTHTPLHYILGLSSQTLTPAKR